MKISVITINYNDLPGLTKTVESVSAQSHKDMEFIVIDGGSSDGSAQYLEAHKEVFSYWLSEPDKGIYNAMNKGISQATGEYILFLNSADVLHDEHVLRDFASANSDADVIYGRILFDYGKGKDLNEWKQPSSLSLPDLYWSSIPHQATFIKRTLFTQHGPYNESLKIVGDWAFNLKLFVETDAQFLFFDRLICIYDKYGLSSSSEYMVLQARERRKVIDTLFSSRMQVQLECLMSSWAHDKRKASQLDGIKKTRFFKLYRSLLKLKRK